MRAVVVALVLGGCGPEEHPHEEGPICSAISEACHEAGEAGDGEAEGCHELAHEGDEARCEEERDRCVDYCEGLEGT